MACRPQSAMHDSKTACRLSVGAITVFAALLVTVGAAQSDTFAEVMRRARYDRPDRKNADVIVAVATYSGFRRFDPRTLRQPDPPTSKPGSNATPPVPSR